MNVKDKKIYCSLDIETSDFDPAVGEILELGMIFFELEKDRLKILSEWTSTFKATKPVPPRILALTGISPEELEDSVPFQDKRAEVQELVKNAVIVGHNINFDTRFLEGFGLQFSGKTIDTLDLAQLFLPTAVSYNLESLMNLLRVDHKEAHRALADSRAAIVVLEKLLAHYAAFPQALKAELQQLYSAKTELGELLRTEFAPQTVQLRKEEFGILNSAEIDRALSEDSAIVCFPLGFDYYQYVYGSLQKSRTKQALVVPSKKVLYQLWKNKLVFPLFENYDLFNREKFEQNFKKKMAPDQRLFFGKVLVWQHTNWQSECLIDLNWSFGSQFRALINFDSDLPPVSIPEPKEKTVAIDYVNFIGHDFSELLKNRKLLILDINNFESSLTYVSSRKVSWGDFMFHLRQIFDPATGYGRKELAEPVGTALGQADLFFGLASMNFRKINGQTPNILVDNNVAARDEYTVISKAAEGFCEKIENLNKKMKSEKVSRLAADLRAFFVVDPALVRWVEISEGRLAFMASPIGLRDIAGRKLDPFKKVVFTASLGSDNLIKYFTGRLNLENYAIKTIGQQELRKKCRVIIESRPFSQERILELVQNLEAPAAILLPNSLALREFYEKNFKILQAQYKVFVQGYTGGTTKMLENFSNAENSLFIATDRFVLKQIGKKLKVKSLVLTRLPFEQFNHPLFAAQAEKYQNQFVDFNIPRALYNFHSVIRFFYNADLEKIHIIDPKISKDYGRYFVDYLKSLPFVELGS